MKPITLLHTTMNVAGGAERFCLDLIFTLKALGHTVGLSTIDRTNWSRTLHLLGPPLRHPDEEHWLFPRPLPIFGLYQRFLTNLSTRWFRQTLTFTTHSTVSTDADLCYVHGVTDKNVADLEYRGLKRLYYLPYKVLDEGTKRNGAYLVANSYYTASRLKAILGLTARKIIYPPVNTDLWRQALHTKPRENMVTTIARFTPQKHLERIIPLAEKMPHVHFVVIGYTPRRRNLILENLLHAGSKLKNLSVYANVGFKTRLRMLSRSKAFLHTGRYEHFGTALCEAISAGCYPIIYPEGGPLEIIKGLEHQEAVTDDEFIKAIEQALSLWSPKKAEVFHQHTVKRFGLARFKTEIQQLLDQFDL